MISQKPLPAPTLRSLAQTKTGFAAFEAVGLVVAVTGARGATVPAGDVELVVTSSRERAALLPTAAPSATAGGTPVPSGFGVAAVGFDCVTAVEDGRNFMRARASA